MNLFDRSISVLSDAKYYLQRISKAEFTTKIDIMSSSTIGQHTRHFIEFYLCLLQQQSEQVIDYCKRKRDMRIESDPREAISAINYIIEHLPNLDLDHYLKLYAEDEDAGFIDSNVAREIYYNIEHTIHHLALIKIALKITCLQLTIPAHFGIAPSTIKHYACKPELASVKS